MTDEADVVVVGAGIMGLAVAYHLARLGTKRVVVLDESYLCGGASGRNGGGVRAQWSSETNVRLMQESIRMCRDFASEMKINVWFRQGGYLFLARTEKMRRSLEKSVQLQNECGLGTRMLSAFEARRVVPELDTDGVLAASYNPDDGVVFPWPFVWGFAQAAEKLGARVLPFTRVTGFETRGGAIEGVAIEAARGAPRSHRQEARTIKTRVVVNAAGAWSPVIARMLGVELPNKPHRHEICSTEPLKPWLKPLVADLSDGLYFSQSTRGEIVGGIGQKRVKEGLNHDSSHAFLGLYSRSLVRACPVLAKVQSAAAMVRLLRPHARREPDRGACRRGPWLPSSVGLHGAWFHDGAHRRQAAGGGDREGDARAPVRGLGAAPVPGGQAAVGVDDFGVSKGRLSRPPVSTLRVDLGSDVSLTHHCPGGLSR